MSQRIRLAIAAPLVLLGVLLLGYSLLTAALGLPDLATWRLWPLAAVGVGLALLLPPILAPRQRELGTLFPVGLPLVAVGALAAATMVFPAGTVWTHFWPQIVLALALGIGGTALYLRQAWLWLPALVLALIGAALQFSALTGWWGAWAVLWTVAPLAFGLWLLIVGRLGRTRFVSLAGGLTCLLSLGLAVGLGALLTQDWSLINLGLALALMAAGGLIIAGSRLRMRSAAVDSSCPNRGSLIRV